MLKVFLFRAVWQFKDNAGRVVNLTSSFYPTVLKQKEFEDGVYTIDYRTVPGQNVFLFNVTKKGLTWLYMSNCSLQRLFNLVHVDGSRVLYNS